MERFCTVMIIVILAADLAWAEGDSPVSQVSDDLSENFQINFPTPVLEPEKFTIADEPRNFPKEAVERGLADPVVAGDLTRVKRASLSTINHQFVRRHSWSDNIDAVQPRHSQVEESTFNQITDPLFWNFQFNPSGSSYKRIKRISKRQIGNNFPNVFKLAQGEISRPVFPDTAAQISFQNSGPSFPSSSLTGDRYKRGHPKPETLFELHFFDNLDTLSAPQSSFFIRPSRNAQHHTTGGPRYPPFDPFGNTQYIPLPVSNPHFALPITQDNPHMKPNFRESFRRPLRSADFFHDFDNFKYESSPEFEQDSVLRLLNDFDYNIING